MSITITESIELVSPSNTPSNEHHEARGHSKMSNFYVIASGYLLFTLSDSALKMIILLELYNRSFNALEISFMFVLYEFLGVVTNLFGGVLGSKWGLRLCLLSGLFFQCIGIGILCGLKSHWSNQIVIVYIALAQGVCGVAKDLIKMSGKSVTKLVSKDEDNAQSSLFKIVAWLTGAKNSVKGLGFFAGAFMINYLNYIITLIILLVINFAVVPFAWFFLERDLGVSKNREPITIKKIFNKNKAINTLSLARVFLFGSRDIWFEVPLPVFLRGVLGLSYILTGTFIAVWVIVYGAVQSMTPQYILKPLGNFPLKRGKALVPWTLLLIAATSLLALATTIIDYNHTTTMLIILIIGLLIFGSIFAVNSSIHSFLIVAYCDHDKVAMNVGFYYMSNAIGRLFGLLTGGLLYWYIGLYACLWASVSFLVVCSIVSSFLGDVPSNDHVE
jgi:MFS family permease